MRLCPQRSSSSSGNARSGNARSGRKQGVVQTHTGLGRGAAVQAAQQQQQERYMYQSNTGAVCTSTAWGPQMGTSERYHEGTYPGQT